MELEEFLEPSDEEVMAYSDEDEDDEDEQPSKADKKQPARKGRAADSEDEEDAEEEEEVGGWGSSKQDYYNADAIETEQDALDEEAEALRIQQKQLQSMTAADYGFDENEWQEAEAEDAKEADEEQATVTEVLPQLQVTEQMGPAERLKLLKSRYPEFEPLSKEFLDLKEQYSGLSQTAPTSTSPVVVTKYRAAAAYLASLTMYFALLTSTADDSKTNGVAMSATQLREHPVMDSLVQCRDLWNAVKELPDEEDEEISDDEEPMEEDMSAQSESDEEVYDVVPKSKKSRKSKAQKAAEAASAEAEARRAERIRQTEADLADLDALTKRPAKARSSKKISLPLADGDDSDFGEETELTAHEAAEKARRKKSLRFYTSQIAQKANKRGAAGRNAGGDEDIPHRERLRDRQARLNAEAERRGKNQERDELGGDSDDEDRRQARELRGEAGAGSEDEYYDMVAAKSSKKKADKKALADAQRAAAEQGGRVVQTEEVGQDGKRAISYIIEKNKGLTPHRKKDVRNPRVKKRKKYEEKKKKHASQRAVYKGGEGRGGYGGELTGIKAGLVKSTKL